ncbi:MAG: hypothetical protein ACP5NX_04745 [Candidatus Bilamarchaeaceae archaeon]
MASSMLEKKSEGHENPNLAEARISIALSKDCPKAVSDEVMKMDPCWRNIKIKEINASLAKIRKAAGENHEWVMFSLDDKAVARLFCVFTMEFVEMAQATKGNAVKFIFDSLKYSNASKAFEAHPDGVVALIKAAGRDGAQGILYALDDETISKLFIDNPGAMVGIAHGSEGHSASRVIKALGGKSISKAFGKYPEAFVQIAKSAGENAQTAFHALDDETVAGLFMRDPEAFVKMAKSSGVHSDFVFNNLGNKEVAAVFNGAVFSSMADTCKDGFGMVLLALGRSEKMREFLLRDQSGFMSAISRISDFSKNFRFGAFSLLAEREVADLFASRPDLVVSLFAKTSKLDKNLVMSGFGLLEKNPVLGAFVEEPGRFFDAIVAIDKYSGSYASIVFYALSSEKSLVAQFAEEPEKFVEIARKYKGNAANILFEMAK